MNARSKNIHISGPIVQSEALAVAKSLRNEVKPSTDGWIVLRRGTILCGKESSSGWL
jgi:hypothetical protein